VLHHHGAEPQDGVEGDHVLRAVGQHQRDPVAGAGAESAQRLRRPRHLGVQFGVRRRGAEEVQRHLAGTARCAAQADQRLLRR
jgi:hypothetical protein